MVAICTSIHERLSSNDSHVKKAALSDLQTLFRLPGSEDPHTSNCAILTFLQDHGSQFLREFNSKLLLPICNIAIHDTFHRREAGSILKLIARNRTSFCFVCSQP